MGRNRPQFPRHLDEIPNYLNHITDWPDEHQATLSTIVDQLVKLLHKLPDYSIKEIIKGGSLGKGTAMKKGSDIDLIVCFNEYNTIEDLIYDKHQIIDDICNYFDDVYIHEFEYMSLVRKDKYLIQYEIRLPNTDRLFHVDILPAMQVVDGRSSPNDLLSVYKEMEFKPDNIRNHYSTCFAKVQRDMVRKKPADVHDLIRWLKSWKNRFHVPIKSYCCEVIALFVHWKCFGEEESFDVSEAFLEAMRFLSRYKTLYIVLPFYYKIKRWRRHFPDKPYILDPVNPFSDTTDRSLDQCDKVKIEKSAKKTLQILTPDNAGQSRSVNYLKDDYIKECANTTPEKFKREYLAIIKDVNPFSDTTDRSMDQCDKVKIEKSAKKTLQILTPDNGGQSRSVNYLKEDYIKECANTTPKKFKPEYSAINIDVNPPPREFKGNSQMIPRTMFSSEPQTIVKMPDNNDDRSMANSKRRDTPVYCILRCLLIFALLLLSLLFLTLEIFIILRLVSFPMGSKFTTTSNSDL